MRLLNQKLGKMLKFTQMEYIISNLLEKGVYYF